ncbi:hypothetical protein GF386_00720 [Candidatus Pacearchaeota archaeon]|nr:hypothetical protein [Candidatus Pacearchaeota archaeon]MBD3282781.1 hypothetical protein [Candidatus Pacearchaeota archaeon]
MIGWFERNNKISWIITILIGIGIFYMSSLQFQSSGSGFGWKPLAYHLTAFFMFSFFLLISLVRGKLNKRDILIAFFISIIYGIFDEIHQIFVPSRAFSLFDILTDSTGVLIAVVIYFSYCRRCQVRL